MSFWFRLAIALMLSAVAWLLMPGTQRSHITMVATVAFMTIAALTIPLTH